MGRYQEYGEENGLEKGNGGYDYLQSKSDADYVTNLNNLVRRDFDVVYGVGYLLEEPIDDNCRHNNQIAQFAIIDAL